jgi:replicative DNA helicase
VTTSRIAQKTRETTVPQNTEAEICVLGAMILAGKSAIETAQEEKNLLPSDFFVESNQLICHALYTLAVELDEGVDIDPISLKNKLVRDGKLDTIGGISYINNLVEYVPTSANLPYYTDIVITNSKRRKIIAASLKTIAIAYDEANDIETIETEAEHLILTATGSEAKTGTTTISQGLEKALDDVWRRKQEGRSIVGLASGLDDWDAILSGLRPKTLNFIIGRPAMGKTGMALEILTYMAIHGAKIGFFSLEMSSEELMIRAIASATSINSTIVQTGQMSDIEYESMVQTSSTMLFGLDFLIDDNESSTTKDIRSRARWMKTKMKGLDVICIDYLQIIETIKDHGTRADELEQICKELKKIAKALNICVICLVQVNKEIEKREDKRPTLGDIHGSDGAAKKADTVTAIYRPAYYERKDAKQTRQASAPPDDWTRNTYDKDLPDEQRDTRHTTSELEREEVELIVLKNRAGRLGTAKADFIPALTKFVNPKDIFEG